MALGCGPAAHRASVRAQRNAALGRGPERSATTVEAGGHGRPNVAFGPLEQAPVLLRGQGRGQYPRELLQIGLWLLRIHGEVQQLVHACVLRIQLLPHLRRFWTLT